MKHVVLYLLSILLCCACCDKTSTRSIPDTDFSRKDFRQSISLSDPDTVVIDDALNPLDFYLVKDSMVLIENADDSQTYKAGIYQLKTGRLIREFARKGEGPEEFVSCQLDVRSNLSDSFFLDDFMQNRYWDGNLLLRYQLDRYIRTVSVDSQEKYLYATSYSSHGAPTVFIKYTLE